MSSFARWWPRRRGQAHDGKRWIVLDVETSGLDARRARLLAIAAVAVRFDAGGRPQIELGDSFEAVLQHPDAPAEKDNILLHGIGIGAQRRGEAPARALQRFEDWVAGAPRIAFHAAFDQAMLDRACRAQLGRGCGGPWLDLEPLAAMARPEVKARSLDEWMAQLGLHCAARHNAAADTLVTAQLLLRLWPALAAQIDAVPETRWQALEKLAAQARWLSRPA